jgi:alanine racemase
MPASEPDEPASEFPDSQNVFEIDLAAIDHNVRVMRLLIGAEVWLCAALKADAYGFGLIPVAETALNAGVDALAVGSIDDAARLREHGMRAPVLVYGSDVLTAASIAVMERLNLIATVFDTESLATSLRCARDHLQVFIEVDVGLQRLGFAPDDTLAVATAIRASSAVELRGVYTHMRVETNKASDVRAQFKMFQELLKTLGPVPMRMAASSRVLDRFSGMNLTAVDPGRAVYGLLSSAQGRLGPNLRPAFTALKSRLITVKYLSPDRQPPGATQPVEVLGVIPFGRAQGMTALDPGGVLVGGRRAPLVGSPSLEHSRVDLSSVGAVAPGDEVVIIGTQRAERITVGDVLERHPELSETAIALAVGQSVRRLYRNQVAGSTG